MRTVMGVMIDIIRPVYRVSRGEVGRTRLFCKGAENLVVKILEVSVARGGTLGRGRGGCDGRHGMDDWSDDCRHTLLQSKRRPSALAITCLPCPHPHMTRSSVNPFGSRDVPAVALQFLPEHPLLPPTQVLDRRRRRLVPECLGSRPSPRGPRCHHSCLACPPARSPRARRRQAEIQRQTRKALVRAKFPFPPHPSRDRSLSHNNRDNFYKTNASNFFKNRKWCVCFFPPSTYVIAGIVGPIIGVVIFRLHLEFPELVAAADLTVRPSITRAHQKPHYTPRHTQAGSRTVVEIGCGKSPTCSIQCPANDRRLRRLSPASHICRRRQRHLPAAGPKPKPRPTYTRVRLFLARCQTCSGAFHLALCSSPHPRQSVDISIVVPAQRPVHIATLRNDHSRGLGPILCRASPGPCPALRRHPRSHLCPQRATPF